MLLPDWSANDTPAAEATAASAVVVMAATPTAARPRVQILCRATTGVDVSRMKLAGVWVVVVDMSGSVSFDGSPCATRSCPLHERAPADPTDRRREEFFGGTCRIAGSPFVVG